MTFWDQASAEEIIADIENFKEKIEKDHKESLALWQLVNHIQHKVNMRELKPEVAVEMLTSLRECGPQDYRKLYIAAVRVPLPPKVYHSAPSEFRAQIEAEGLRMALPSDGHWNMNAGGQPRAVYLSPEPDELGMWATTEEWDIWEVTTKSLTWRHDDMNIGCWAVLQDIPAEQVRFIGTRTLAGVRAKA